MAYLENIDFKSLKIIKNRKVISIEIVKLKLRDKGKVQGNQVVIFYYIFVFIFIDINSIWNKIEMILTHHEFGVSADYYIQEIQASLNMKRNTNDLFEHSVFLCWHNNISLNRTIIFCCLFPDPQVYLNLFRILKWKECKYKDVEMWGWLECITICFQLFYKAFLGRARLEVCHSSELLKHLMSFCIIHSVNVYMSYNILIIESY